MEIVWINDGSTEENTAELEDELRRFQRTTRFTTVKYQHLITNIGLYEALALGVELCSHSLIFRIDADDIMIPYRILHQSQFMKSNPMALISSAGVRIFEDNDTHRTIKKDIIHPPIITLTDFLRTTPTWLMNHTTVCFYKEAVLTVGNYNKTVFHKTYADDYALILRFLKEYGAVYNIQEILGLYRFHTAQTTQTVAKLIDTNELLARITRSVLTDG
jgi:amylovoran biosynthesis glycosyltransferase AmsE